MNTFKGHKGNISWFGLNGLLVNEYLFPKTKEDLSIHLWKPLHTKEPIDDLYREPCISQ